MRISEAFLILGDIILVINAYISVPGKLKKFGLSWEEVKEMNPRLIYCSITGDLFR